MKADFSGYASKAGVRCSDGRTIMVGAFKHQHQVKVPLVWQHGHSDPENVLGHAILEDRDDGTYCYAFFNDSKKAQHMKHAVDHEDITMMSIWANQLVERDKIVHHGTVREVSLVLSGANPGAVIDNLTIRHSDGDLEVVVDEAFIYTGIPIEHGEVSHAEGDDDDDDQTLIDIYEAMSDEEKDVVHYMVAKALEAPEGDDGGDEDLQQSNTDSDGDADEDDADGDDEDEDDDADGDDDNLSHENNNTEGHDMTGTRRNIFEDKGKGGDAGTTHVLSHSDISSIMLDADESTHSLKKSVNAYALAHGITNIDALFPEARTLTTSPEWEKRQTEWVGVVLGGTRKSPFARIKTWTADITYDEARAKGYVKGNMKKEEWFSIAHRETQPQTVYKKQKLDRDDIIDITDFDVVVWMKGEMRLMLDEEIARAVLVGDGRAIDDPDKIFEDKIRPIATDDEYYTIPVGVNLDNADSTVEEVLDAIILNRQYYKGTNPTFFTTETFIAQCLLLRDDMGRKLYRNIEEVATEMRVSRFVAVEILDEYPDTIGILVNLQDYVIGTDKGGNVAMFDDFDIDFNQYKYLIESRLSGALTKPKTAMHVFRTGDSDVAATAVKPDWDAETSTVTVPAITGVDWKNIDTGATVASGAVVLDPQETLRLQAVPEAGYYLNPGKTSWSYMGVVIS